MKRNNGEILPKIPSISIGVASKNRIVYHLTSLQNSKSLPGYASLSLCA